MLTHLKCKTTILSLLKIKNCCQRTLSICYENFSQIKQRLSRPNEKKNYYRQRLYVIKNHKNSEDDLTQIDISHGKEQSSVVNSFSTVSTAQHKVHGKQISTYECPKMELRGLSPNFHIHVSVRDLYIPDLPYCGNI